jgi:hypothetical protein
MSDVSEKPVTSIFMEEDTGNWFLRNVGTYLKTTLFNAREDW